MRLTGLFSGREAMMSESVALATAADNIANLNTTGFKSQSVEFADLLADSVGSLYGSELNPGNGVQVSKINLLADKQGSIDNTERSLDWAISGGGFFVVNDGTTDYYTRAGDFSADKEGNLITNTGEKVLGFADDAAAAATPINLKSRSSIATASTAGKLSGNLNSGSPIVTAPSGVTDFKILNATADLVSPLRVYDSLGKGHEVSLYFYHTANLEYTVQAYVDATDTDAAATPNTAVSLGSTTVTYQSDGLQAAGSTAALAISGNWANGAAASAVALDLSKTTGFSSSSSLDQVVIDGNAQGNAIKFQAKSDGTVVAITDIGTEVVLGRVAIAKFINPNGLKKIGNNKFALTEESGEADVKRAAVEGRGEILDGSLENSNVDPSSEFVEVIKHQRAYQAASQIIQTYSQLLGATAQLI